MTSHIPLHALWLQAAALVVTLGGLIAGVVWNVKVARRRATLDILLQEQSVETLAKERSRFAELIDAGNLVQFADEAPPHQTRGRSEFIVDVETVRSALNRYELIALGIRHSAVDEAIYKGWCRTTLVGEWIATKWLVERIRSQHGVPTYLVEFEQLAKRWAEGKEKAQV